MMRFGRLAVAAVGFLLASQAACGTSNWQDWTGLTSTRTVTKHTTIATTLSDSTVTTYEETTITTLTTCSDSEGCAGASDSSVATASGTDAASSSASPSSVSSSSASAPSVSTSSASSSTATSASSASSSTDTTVAGSSQTSQSTDTGSTQDTGTQGSGTESTSATSSSSGTSQSSQSTASEGNSSAESSANTASQSSPNATDAGSSESTQTGGAASTASSESTSTDGATTGQSTTTTGAVQSPSSTTGSSPTASSSSSVSQSTPASTSSSSGAATSSGSGSASRSSLGSTSTASLSSTGATNGSPSDSPSSGVSTTETLTISSVGSYTTLVTVVITTHLITSNSQSSKSGSSGTTSSNSSTGSTQNVQSSESSSAARSPTPAMAATPTIPPQSATCGYGVMPWCTAAPMLPSSYGCLCPYCWAPSDLCEANKPTDTASCPDLGWFCSLTTDDSTVVHSVPPGTELITFSPTTSTLPWWDYISSLHATDDVKHTSDAHFNATLKTSTKVDSEHHTTLYPYRAWECVAGPVCYPPNFDFGCLFPNPLNCANGITQFFGIWPRPKIPFPPPVAPPEFDWQLETSIVGGDNGGDPTETASDPETKTSSSSSSECSSSVTYSTCSTTCSTVMVSSSASETCTSTCTTTSGCSGSDSDATSTASACSYSPYWDDPVISSSVSSLLAQFPFTFPETIEIVSSTSSTSTSSFDAKTLPSGGCSSGLVSVSGTTISGAVCTDQLGVPFTSVSGSLLTRSSSGAKTSSSSDAETPTTAECSPTPVSVRGSTVSGAVCTSLGVVFTSVPPGPAPSSSSSSSKSSTRTPPPTSTKPAWALSSKACAEYTGEFDYTPLDEVARHDKTYCVTNEAPKGKEGLFKWDPVSRSDGAISEICKSLAAGDVNLSDDNPAQCILRGPEDLAERTTWGVLFRVAKTIRACKGKGTQKDCDDDYCDKDYAFANNIDACIKNFGRLGKCQGDTWDNDSGDFDTAGGTYYNDCVAWSIVAPEKD